MGWDNLASHAASTEGQGERTDTALIVHIWDLISALISYALPTPLCFDV